MSVAQKLRELRWRAAGHASRTFGDAWIEPLRDAHALEVGGPSRVFGGEGLVPVYPVLASLDGVQVPRGHEAWHGELREGVYETGQEGLAGTLWLREGSDLSPLPADGYDAILSSHVIEHLANPLGALREWLRVLRPGGHVLTIAPHKEGCADHRRPVTSLEHLRQDAAHGTDEDDLTHADEVIALHDLERDPAAGTPDAHRARTLANPDNRAMHHHVLTTRSLLRLLDCAGLQLLQVEPRWPHDVYTLARLPTGGGAAPDNRAFLASDAAFLRTSPFRADRAGEDGS